MTCAGKILLRNLHCIPRYVLLKLGPISDPDLNFDQEGKLDIKFKVDGDESDYSQMSRMVLYRAVQEGLTNAHKHAAASRVSLWLQFKNKQAHLRIVDNGTGFDAEEQTRGMGLQGIRERVAKLGGSFAIDSRLSEGTVLDILIPNGA